MISGPRWDDLVTANFCYNVSFHLLQLCIDFISPIFYIMGKYMIFWTYWLGLGNKAQWDDIVTAL